MEISNPDIEIIEDPKSHHRCSFCDSVVNNPLRYGDMYKYKNIICHYFCVLMSSQLQQNGEDNEGFFGFLIDDLKKELERAKTVKCCFCKRPGATAQCNFKNGRKKCQNTFHFTCGITHGTLHYFFGKFQSLCDSHRRSQKIPEEFIKDSATQCWICHDLIQDVSSDFSSLWAPCCKKSYFHKDCVQRHAFVSGDYHFKCPLCNNKDEFKRAMLHCGIFLPVRDAEWEREPNAFSDLYREHNQCDVEMCICPHSTQDSKKRQYNSGAWDIVRCFTCGSEGTHRPCAGLPLKGDITWSCGSCRQIINKDKETGGSGSQDAEKEKVIEPDTCCADVCSCNKGREYRADKGMYRAVYCSDCEYSWIHTRCRNAAYGEVARGEWICTGCQMSDDEDSNSPGTSGEVAGARDPFAAEELTKKQVLSPCYVLVDRLFTRGSYLKFSHLLSRRAYEKLLLTRRKTMHALGFVFTGQTYVKRNEANETVDKILGCSSGDLKDGETFESGSGMIEVVETMESASSNSVQGICGEVFLRVGERASTSKEMNEKAIDNAGVSLERLDLTEEVCSSTEEGVAMKLIHMNTDSEVNVMDSNDECSKEEMSRQFTVVAELHEEKVAKEVDEHIERVDGEERSGMGEANMEGIIKKANENDNKTIFASIKNVVSNIPRVISPSNVETERVERRGKQKVTKESGVTDKSDMLDEEMSRMGEEDEEISSVQIEKRDFSDSGISESKENSDMSNPEIFESLHIESKNSERTNNNNEDIVNNDKKEIKESSYTQFDNRNNIVKSVVDNTTNCLEEANKVTLKKTGNVNTSNNLESTYTSNVVKDHVNDTSKVSEELNSRDLKIIKYAEKADSLNVDQSPNKEETNTVKTTSKSKRWKNPTPLKMSRSDINDEALSRCQALSVCAPSTAQICREKLNSGKDFESNFSAEKSINDNVNPDDGSETGLKLVEKLQEVKKTDTSNNVENMTNTCFKSVNTNSDSQKENEEVLTNDINIVRIRKTKCMKQGDVKGRKHSEPLLFKYGIKPLTRKSLGGTKESKSLARRKRDSIRHHKYKMNRSLPQATDSKERKRSLALPELDSLKKAYYEKLLKEHGLEPEQNSLCGKRKCSVYEENLKAKKTRTSFNTKNNTERLKDTLTNSSVESKWKSALNDSITNGLGTQDSICGVAMKESNALKMNRQTIARDARTNERVLRRSRLVVQYEEEEICFKNIPHKEHGKEKDTRGDKLNDTRNENEPDEKSDNISRKVNEHGRSKIIGKSIMEVFNNLLNSSFENSIDKPTANTENGSKELFTNFMNKIQENSECGAMSTKPVEETTPEDKKTRHAGHNMQAVSYSTKKIYEYFNCSTSTAAICDSKTSTIRMNSKPVATSTSEKTKIERTSRKRSISESLTESISQSGKHSRKRTRLMSTSAHGEETQLVPKRDRKFTGIKVHSSMKQKSKSKEDTTSRKIYEFFSLTASPSPVGSDLHKSNGRKFYNGLSSSDCKVFNRDARDEGYNHIRETKRNSEQLHKAITDESLREVTHSDTRSKRNIQRDVHDRTTRSKGRNRDTNLTTARSNESKTNFNITDFEIKHEVSSTGRETVSNRDNNHESVCIEYNQPKEMSNISDSEKTCIDNTNITKEKFATSDSTTARQGRFTVTDSDSTTARQGRFKVTDSDVESKQVRVLRRRHTMTDENDSPNKPVHDTLIMSRSRRASTRMSGARRDLSHLF